MCFNYRENLPKLDNSFEFSMTILVFFVKHNKIPQIEIKIVFKSFNYILTTFQTISKYSWFGKGRDALPGFEDEQVFSKCLAKFLQGTYK